MVPGTLPESVNPWASFAPALVFCGSMVESLFICFSFRQCHDVNHNRSNKLFPSQVLPQASGCPYCVYRANSRMPKPAQSGAATIDGFIPLPSRRRKPASLVSPLLHTIRCTTPEAPEHRIRRCARPYGNTTIGDMKEAGTTSVVCPASQKFNQDTLPFSSLTWLALKELSAVCTTTSTVGCLKPSFLSSLASCVMFVFRAGWSRI